MKKVLFTFTTILVLALAGCATEKYLNVSGDLISAKRGANQLTVTQDGFQDKMLITNLSLDSNIMSIKITNTSDSKILINWKKSALVDTKNQAHKIYFSTGEDLDVIRSTYKGPAEIQEPTILLPGSYIAGEIKNKDSYIYGTPQRTSGHWVGATYVPRSSESGYYLNKGIITSDNQTSLRDDANANLGKTIKLILATETNGKKFDYTATFTVTEFSLN